MAFTSNKSVLTNVKFTVPTMRTATRRNGRFWAVRIDVRCLVFGAQSRDSEELAGYRHSLTHTSFDKHATRAQDSVLLLCRDTNASRTDPSR